MTEAIQDMKEIKVMVFGGNMDEFAQTSYRDVVLADRFAQSKGYSVQQFSYNCAMHRDEANGIYGRVGGLVIDFTVRVMEEDQTLFYEKLQENGSDHYSFLFNAVFNNGRFMRCDNAITVDGFIVDVVETASNDFSQALMHVKLLAREVVYVRPDGEHLIMNISNLFRNNNNANI